MPQTLVSMAVNIVSKKLVSMTGTMALYENPLITITGTGYAPDNLTLALIGEGVLLADIPQGGFTSGGGGVQGSLNLNTQQMINLFSPDVGRTMRPVVMAIYDIGTSSLLCNDRVYLLNNPFNQNMATPTPVPPIGGGSVVYLPLADYTSDYNTKLVLRNALGANYRISADNLTIELKDVVDNSWHTLVVASGTIGLSPAL